MYEQEMMRYLKNLGKQLNTIQVLMARLDMDIRKMHVSGNTIVKTMPFGVKDISTAQLVDAYTRGLNMEQLLALANGKYSAEQIYTKLRKAGAVQ